MGTLTLHAVLEAHVLVCGRLTAEGTAGDRMRPALCIEGSSGFELAARRLAAADVPHAVVVDPAGVAVGIVSALDVLRAMVNLAVRHPPTSLHWDDARQSTWTDYCPLDEAHVFMAPDAAGVLVLSREAAGDARVVVWVEGCEGVRGRLAALVTLGASTEPALARLFERYDLQFRAAVVPNDAARERIVLLLSGALRDSRAGAAW